MGKSLTRNWDYRWKLVSFILLIFCISFVSRPCSMVLAFSISLIELFMAGITLKEALRSLKPPIFLLVLMSPFILFTPGSTLLFQWNFVEIYSESVTLLYSIAVKSLSIFIIFTTLLYNVDIPVLMKALKMIGLPTKLVIILISTYRYIFIYMDDLRKLMDAAKLRGFSMKKGFSHMETSADILLTLLIRSYEQSERIQAAMVMRGYRGDFYLTHEFKTAPSDIYLTFITLLFSGGIIMGEYLC